MEALSKHGLAPLKHLCHLNPEVLPEGTPPDTEFEYIDIGSVSHARGITSKERMTFAASPSRARKPVRRGDVIVSTVRTYLRAIARIEAIDDGSVVSTGFAVCRPLPSVHPGFLSFAIQSDPFVEEVVAFSVGVSYPTINPTTLGSICLPRPDFSTQKRIADFLDRETGRIDELIGKKDAFRDLILAGEEARFFTKVTGREVPGPRLPSGVDWIGSLPEGWLAPKFTMVARQETGHTPSRKESSYWTPEDCVIPWVSLADVWQLRSGQTVYLEDTAEKISEIGMANSSARLLPAETVVLSRTASVGFSGILAKPMATTQDFAAWICGPTIRPKFLYYVLRAMKPEFRRLMMGSTHQTIYMPDIRSFRTPLPRLVIQDRIIAELDASIGNYRKVHEKLTESITKLREYRAALITAAVTGQIDVDRYGQAGRTSVTLDRIEEEMQA